MKKFAALLMGIILLLSMVACGNKTTSDQSPDGQITSEDRISLGTDDSESTNPPDESEAPNTSEDSADFEAVPDTDKNNPVQDDTPSSETETPNRPNNNGSVDKPSNNQTPAETNKPDGANQEVKPNNPVVTQPSDPPETQPPESRPEPTPSPKPDPTPVPTPTPTPTPEPMPDPIPESPKPEEDGKTLIVYFSWSSNTERMANTIKEQTGGDLLELVPVNAYPTDYTACTEVALAECDSNARPAIQNLPSSISKYDKILSGYPIWWHTAPMIIGTFLDSYDLTGIDVYPFTQSASMDREQFNNSMEFVRECAIGATVHDGLFARYSDTTAITTYLNNNNLSK